MHIVYSKMPNGVEYARLATSTRKGKNVEKTSINLGKVIDKNKGIYKSRKQGIFHFDLSTMQYTPVDDLSVPQTVSNTSQKEKLILDFGDTYLLDNFMADSGLKIAIDAVACHNIDTLYAMICYYILNAASNCHAASWYEGNYARLIYPKAQMSSQRISEFLSEIGSEEAYRRFFAAYFDEFTKHNDKGSNILIDSTGLPNSIHFPLTAINNHNGEISNEARLIYVTQQETGLPLFFRYCPGNVIDVSTLVRTIKELSMNGIDTNFAILDAGYYDTENINELYDNSISFVTRLKGNLKLYCDLVKEHLGSLTDKENFIRYNDRFVYIKCVKCNIEGHTGYAYIGLDIERKNSETKKLFKNAKALKLSDSDVYDRMSSQGVFILVSSRRIAKDKILPLYYTRQQIEQVFDIGKNYADMLPLRVQNEDTFRGHLLLTFIATVIIKLIQDKLKGSAYNPISLFMNMRNQKCKVYDDRIITQEAFKKANDCYKLFGIDCPVELMRV